MEDSLPGSGFVRASAALSQLIDAVHRAAVDLSYVSTQAHDCTQRYPLDHTANLTVKERIEQHDREAIYDAIVETTQELDRLRELIGMELSGSDYDVLARTLELRDAKATGRCTATICSSRWRQETADMDAGGKERQRKAASKGKSPAGQGGPAGTR